MDSDLLGKGKGNGKGKGKKKGQADGMKAMIECYVYYVCTPWCPLHAFLFLYSATSDTVVVVVVARWITP